MIKQMRNEYRVKSEPLKPWWERAQKLVGEFGSVVFAHVPRTDPDIARADELANEALDSSAC